MITLNCGNYSNHVGAHLFNLQLASSSSEGQESSVIPPSSLWRQTSEKSSPVPRALFFDTRNNLAIPHLDVGVGQHGGGDHDPTNSVPVLWEGKVENLLETAEVEAGSSDMSKWTHIPTWKLNPRTIHFVPNFAQNLEVGGMVAYSQGLDAYKEMEEGVEDGIRKYAEECDRLDGFNLLVDQLDGYSGLGGGILQLLGDDYDKKLCLGFPICPPLGPTFKRKMSNTALLWNAFNEHSSVFTSLGLCRDFSESELVPIQLPHLQYKGDVAYESSAIIALALDSLLSPCVSSKPHLSSVGLLDLASFLSAMGRKLTTVSMSFPFPLEVKKSTLFGMLNSTGLDCSRSLTPGVSVDFEGSNRNYISLRGVSPTNVISMTERKGLLRQHSDIKDAQSCLELYVGETFPSSINMVQSVETPLTIVQPFPVYIVDEYAKENFSSSHRYSKGSINAWSFSCMTSAHNNPKTAHLIDKVVVEAKGMRANQSRITQSLPSRDELGMDIDDFLSALNNLEALRDEYTPD